MMHIGENIRNFRKSKKLSRNDVQNISGINFQYLGEIERGESNPTIEMLMKLSKAFGVTISELIGEEEEKYSKELKQLIENAKSLDKEQIESLINLAIVFNKPKH